MSGRGVGRVASVAVLTAIVCGLAGPSAGGATGLRSAHAASVVVVSVTAVEYRFTLSRKSAGKGRVSFRIRDRGKLPHDFKINGVTSRVIAPSGSASITVNFKKTGTYRYQCTIPGHAQRGMKGTFRIT